ncbi:MAG: hypothetical protein SGILL_002519 [Bacillariaceae sp.]
MWKILYVFFSLFLLFGPSIQYLVVDEAGDIVFEIVRNVMLAFFIIDMIIRCVTDHDYFVCTLCCGNGAASGIPVQPTGGSINSLAYVETKDTEPFAFGSFLFWCDLVSTLAILYDLSYINPNVHGFNQVEIGLDSDGIPVSGFDVYQRLRPVEIEFALLVVIARSARCARFVQHRAVVGASNKINWCWMCNLLKWLNPFFYYQRFRRQRYQARMSSMGVGGETGTFATTTTGGNSSREQKNSWGALHIGILAAVHAQAESETRDSSTAQSNSSKSIWSNFKKGMQYFGMVRAETTATEKHAAALKIQRAWRNHVNFEGAMSVDGEFGEIGFLMDGDATRRSHQSDGKERLRASSSSLSRTRRNGTRTSGRLSMAPESRFQSQAGKGRESQVGSDMRELTGQRVAIGTLLALICTVLFTYTEASTTWPTAMVVLHEQTMYSDFQAQAVSVAVNTTLPELYMYQPADGSSIDIADDSNLRERDKLVITVTGSTGTSTGWFDFRSATQQAATVDIVATIFILVFWFFGVTAFSGPVMLLVITPIERMVRLLGMLMMDPLGYQSTARFQRFMHEEDDIIKNTRWTKDVLKGMETSFLMSTILRIGSLMKVGFGSAGVEIIRNNLQKGQSKNSFILNSQGSTVSCIFLFCDIRQFTDATECLQEEVFVFTNKIAAVVHSICHSYGGAANKNIGDAFLLSWSLEDQSGSSSKPSDSDDTLKATSNQADKALLSVIKICISLYYDKFYLEPLTETAKGRLRAKLKNRSGPVVQMGFGLHAGKAVQGAIGSPRKIDATYVSEAVVGVEWLEGSTKTYDLPMLMSGSFHSLLHPSTKRRCRMIDKVFIVDEDEDADEDDDELHGERMDIYTFDMDASAIHRPNARSMKKIGEHDTLSDGGSMNGDPARLIRSGKRVPRRSHGSDRQVRNRRRSTAFRQPGSSNALSGEISEDFAMAGGTMMDNGNLVNSTGQGSVSSIPSEDINPGQQGPPELVLPTGPALYSHNVWQNPDMKKIRDKYVQGLFFQKFNEGLQAYYSKDWDSARVCFQLVLENFDDGPSKYFLAQMKMYNGVPPRDFRPYGVV